MRLTTCLLFTMLLLSSCYSTKNISNFDEKNQYSDNNNVLGLNSINADNNYYTKAVLDYLLVKNILDGYSFNYFGMPENMPVKPVIADSLVQKKVLFPELQGDNFPSTGLNKEIIKKLKNKGIKHCIYDIPKELNDLRSGFQFNHYVFKSNNRAAMQAFGIVNSEAKQKALYIVTDYLQHQDINCTGMPIVRYAIGVRAEFKILGIESESELSGIGSLAGLAAQVETNQQQVNITIKTIGVTGIDSRMTIPSNTSFNVKTYSDYEKILDFIRNLKNVEDENLIIAPQIIPVMDEYRTTIAHSVYPMLESIEILELKLKDYEKEGVNQAQINKIKTKIHSLKIKIIGEEVDKLVKDRLKLIESNNQIENYKDITELINLLRDNREGINYQKILKELSK